MMRDRPLLAALSHPVTIAAVALLLMNDHVLKSAWRSSATGKLSDVAGLVFFPLLLGALIGSVAPRRWSPRWIVAGCIAATALVFAAI